MLNLATLLDSTARKYPGREALVMGSTRIPYAKLDAMACQVAHGLRSLGVEPGDHVALSCPNLPYFPVVYYGILKAGAAVVPLNVLLKGPEIAYHLQDSEAKAYFCFEGTAELPMGRMGHEGFREAGGCEHFVLITADPAAPSPIEGVRTLGMLMHGRPPAFETADRDPDDTAVILYTSGTTGRPKGAELTHSNMLVNAVVSRDIALPELDPAAVQVALVALPLFHSFGQTCQMNAGVLGGSTLVLVPRFEPGPVLELFAKEKVTLFAGVPTMYWALLQHARQHGVDAAPIAENLKVCTSGGAAMPVEVLKAFEATFNVKVLEGYGLSETAPAATFNHVDLPRKVGSIGVPVFGCEVRVVDLDGNEVPAGQPGEIVIRGHNVMKGYYRRPEATAEALRGGWFHTGDVAVRDEDGYLFIVDRLKDMIIRGGFNVYPREIEEKLLEHPAVSLAAVVGVPDERSGEEIMAYVIRQPGAQLTEAELIAWCRERMADYKYPRTVEFREELPMTATGKILKRELRHDASAARPLG
ncbi:MAG TPA: long-chain fatty acid--CoA ligase [Longimicrobiaceae bacterium]|nr:long-chain fatty acid--CoA ligase [Longimicrobiaceae bacterium]